MAALVLAGPVAVVAPVVGGIAAATGASAAVAPCPAAPTGRISVTVVIDDGASVRIRCVEVADRATGGEALLAAATVRRDDPTKGPAFVCGIDGVPVTGCAAVNEPYWSYWTGAATWSYQTVGAFGYRLPARCAVEGWRFGTGKVEPATAVPPTPCSAPPPTAPPTTAAAGVVPPPAARPAVPVPPPAGAGGPASAPRVAGATTVVPGAGGAGGPVGPDGAPATAPGSPAPAESGDTAPAPDPTTTSLGPGTAAGDTGAPSSADRGAPGRSGELAEAASRRARSGGTAPGWAIVVGAVAIVGLGAAAWVRSRRDRSPSAV